MAVQDRDVAAVEGRREAQVRPEAASAPESGIVEVANRGWGREGLIPLWAGEGDMPTPGFICEAATRSLAAGETFYTRQRGIPELREALAGFTAGLYGGTWSHERFFVTCGGMQACQIALRIAAGAGDEVLIPTPAWPNFMAAIGVGGATPVGVPMENRNGAWVLDIDRLAAAIGPRTRAIVINSPANPTGWTATRDELEAILALARRHGLWIVADEIYGRFTYDGSARTTAFKDVADQDDAVLYVQTFSKNWAMTGWRLGWLEAPVRLGQTIENLIQYSTSGVPVFAQRAGIAAIAQGESFALHQIERAKRGRRIVMDALAETGRVRTRAPDGAFYAFFRIDGIKDTRAAALRIVDEIVVGLAPGSAFGQGGEDHMRLCFLRKAEELEEAMARLSGWIARQP
jgi:aspartate/methionine/tyrosine aminotransferase